MRSTTFMIRFLAAVLAAIFVFGIWHASKDAGVAPQQDWDNFWQEGEPK